MLAEWTSDDVAMALDAVAEAILREGGVFSPPIHAFALAERLGIAVAPDDAQAARARYVRLRCWAAAPQPAILLRADPRPEREHWAVAHEIGEHAAHRVFARLNVDACEAPSARESIANGLAARLLLPAAWFHADGRESDWDLLALKRRYSTASHELIARRMLDARPPIIISVFDHGQLVFRRGNLPGGAATLTPAERQCQRSAHRSGVPCSARRAGCTVTAWPIHEPDWPREILRAEVDEYSDAAPDEPWVED